MVSDVAKRLQQAPTEVHFPVKKQLKKLTMTVERY